MFERRLWAVNDDEYLSLRNRAHESPIVILIQIVRYGIIYRSDRLNFDT